MFWDHLHSYGSLFTYGTHSSIKMHMLQKGFFNFVLTPLQVINNPLFYAISAP